MLSSFTFLCAVVLPALVVSSFAIFVFPASPLLPFVDYPMSFVPCRLRLCSAPLSPFGPSCLEPRKTKRNRAWPRSPLPSPLLNLPPSGEGAATSKAVIDEWTACIATNHYTLMFPIV
jgi:hypothetical protein